MASPSSPARVLAVALAALLTFGLASSPAAAAADDGPGSPSARLLVQFRDGGLTPRASALLGAARARRVGRIAPLGVQVLSVPAARAERALAVLRSSPAVTYAELDARVDAADTVPNDPYWASQWGPARTNTARAWDTATGDPSVVVAVLDTGVDASHPDLAGALVAGTDLVNSDANPADDNGHGTAVAGIVAARTDNLAGIAAYCWRCAVMPVKVLGADGSGSMSAVASGITWAADHGARVVNLSLGGPSGTTTLERAVSYARSKGVVVVSAAGNDGTTAMEYPAAYPGVISVAGTDATDARYSWSNHGSWVQVAAPGCHIGSLRGGGYGNFCGTSSATPAVAGIAALAFSASPSATGTQVEDAITSTATDVGTFVAHGRVDAAATLASVSAAPPPAPAGPPAAPGDVAATRGNASASVTWTPPADDGGSPVTSYTVTAHNGTTPRTSAVVAAPATSATVSGLTNGATYTFTVRASNSAGTGPASAPSNPVVPATVPGAPTGVSATAGPASATVAWNPPSGSGGSSITGYVVTASPSGTTVRVDGTATEATVAGLTNGTAYTFTVAASNDIGTGPASAASSPVTPSVDPVVRLAGADRVDTAIAISNDSYPRGDAGAVVLSRADSYADALAGTPLAVAENAPLLLTSQSGLDPRTQAEIQRVLPPGRTVHLLGGTAAVASGVESQLDGLGYRVVRYAGEDRFETAVRIADEGLGNPTSVLLATGADFRDALIAGATAPSLGAAVLLTDGSTMPAATATWILAHPTATRYAIGTPAATADPGATPIAGTDAVETSRKVAERFFTAPTTVALASVANFPDALGGGAHIGRKRAPLLLTDPAVLSPTVSTYLSANRGTIAGAYVDGGTATVADAVRSAVEQAIS
jgi:subtilisin family serine protease